MSIPKAPFKKADAGVTENVADLGELKGDIAVFGGAYSNLQACEAFFEAVEALRIPKENRIFTGDAIAYCGNPREVVALLDDRCHWLAGNCESQIARGAADCGCGFDLGSTCDLLSAQWYQFAASKLAQDDVSRLAQCPDVMAFGNNGKRFAVVHGGASEQSKFIWPSDPEDVFVREFEALADLVGPIDHVLAGHCGVAFERKVGARSWINAGVIGMPPNDGRAETRFAILNQDGVHFRRLSYDHVSAARSMRDQNLCAPYEAALMSGVWPSEDILPKEMRRHLAD